MIFTLPFWYIYFLCAILGVLVLAFAGFGAYVFFILKLWRKE